MNVGDPAGMRLAASRVSSAGDRVAAVAARLGQGTDQMQFQGPAADDVRARATARVSILHNAARLCADLSTIIVREAAVVEAAQAEEARRNRQD